MGLVVCEIAVIIIIIIIIIMMRLMTHVKVIHRVKNRKCGWSQISEGKLGCKVQSRQERSETMSSGKLFQTAGAACEKARSAKARKNLLQRARKLLTGFCLLVKLTAVLRNTDVSAISGYRWSQVSKVVVLMLCLAGVISDMLWLNGFIGLLTRRNTLNSK